MAIPYSPPTPVAITDDDKARLEDLCVRRQMFAKTRDASQKSIDELSTEIGIQLAILGTNKIETATYVAQVVDAERKTLSKTRLLELGVSAATITAAEEITRTSSVRVSLRK